MSKLIALRKLQVDLHECFANSKELAKPALHKHGATTQCPLSALLLNKNRYFVIKRSSFTVDMLKLIAPKAIQVNLFLCFANFKELAKPALHKHAVTTQCLLSALLLDKHVYFVITRLRLTVDMLKLIALKRSKVTCLCVPLIPKN